MKSSGDERQNVYEAAIQSAKEQLEKLLEVQPDRHARLGSLLRFAAGLRFLVENGAEEFQSALDRAEKEVKELSEPYEQDERRKTHLEKVVVGGQALLGKSDDAIPVGDDPVWHVPASISLTVTIRELFGDQEEGTFLTTREVCDMVSERLRMYGQNLKDRYKQPLVPINNTLQRLVAQDELKTCRNEDGHRAYKAQPLLLRKLPPEWHDLHGK